MGARGTRILIASARVCAAVLVALLAIGRAGAQTPPPALPAPAAHSLSDSLDLADEQVQAGRFSESEALLRRLLPRLESMLNAPPADLARGQDLLVTVLWRTGRGQAEESLPLARRATALKREIYGDDHLEVAHSLFNEGILQALGGNHAVADSLFARVLVIRETHLPENHSEISSTIRALANVRLLAGQHARALELYERTLALLEARGEGASDFARAVRTGIAQCLSRLGRYAQARALFERQIELEREQEHGDLPLTLNALANLYKLADEYIKSSVLYREALELADEREGPLGPWSVIIRLNLASDLIRLGDYTEARGLLESLIELLLSHELETPQLARAYSLMGSIYTSIGDAEEELHHRRECLRLREQLLPPGHPGIAEALINLAGAFGRLGRLEEQDRLIDKAFTRMEKCHPPDSPERIKFLESLADMLINRMEWARAEELLRQAIAIREQTADGDTPGLAIDLYELGRIARHREGPRAALPYLERAVSIGAAQIGEDHPIVAEHRLELAEVEFALGYTQRSLERALAAEPILTAHLRLTLAALPESQALQYAARRSGDRDLLLQLLEERHGAADIDRVWDAVIRTRAIVQDQMAERMRRQTHPDPAQAVLLGSYRMACTRLANLCLRGPEETDPEPYGRMLDEARRELNRAERDIAKAQPNEAWTGGDQPGWDPIRAALPGDCALLAYARYAPVTPSGGGPAASAEPEGAYRAFVQAGWEPESRTVHLGSADEIDQRLTVWRDELALGLLAGDRTPGDAERRCIEAGRAVREAVWDPVAPYLERARIIFVVADGMIHLVNLSALPRKDAGYLVEAPFLLHSLTAERELLQSGSDRAGPGTARALVLGAPDFGEPAERTATPRASFNGTSFAPPECLVPGVTQFAPLPGALLEAEEIAGFWSGSSSGPAAAGGPDAAGGPRSVLLLTGPEATEERFKHLAPGREVLHLATHGYVLDGSCSPQPAGSRGIGLLIADDPAPAARPAGPAPPSVRQSAQRKNPLLLAGLVLAGANQADVSPDGDDGFLTAQEIAALDLTATRYAVLSACKTGMGSMHRGEGVLGLRRAFHIAGARSLISSLWSVHDETTRDWMRAFYLGITEQQLGTAEAVRNASRTLIEQRRARGLDTHPFHWAPFFASGDWR